MAWKEANKESSIRHLIIIVTLERGGIEGIPLPWKELTETTEIDKSGLALYTTFIEQKRIGRRSVRKGPS